MADAFFRFGTDIEQTRRQIAAGLQGIASDLAKSRGGNVNMFDGLVASAQAAAQKASAALAGIGGRLGQGYSNLSRAGGGDELQRAYQNLKAQAVAETTAAGRELGMSRGEIARANQQVRSAIEALFKSIAAQLAADQKLSRAAFLRGEVPGRGLDPNQRAGRPAVPTAATQDIARIEALGPGATASLQRRAAQLRAQEGLKPGQAAQVVKEFNDQFARDVTEARDIQRRRNAQIKQDATQANHERQQVTAVEKSIARNQAKQARELQQEVNRAHTEGLREQKARRERALHQQVMDDPTTRAISGGRFIQGQQVFKTGGEGLVLERNLAKQTRAFQDSEKAIYREAQSRSLIQSFLGGLTSSGFGGHASGFDPSGVARSFGSTVKFSAQYAALQMVQAAFTDTIREAVDYRDSLTDLNVALGEGNEANARYVDGLSEISKLAGGNVGEALDSAARGVRAFAYGEDQATKTQVGQDFALQARNLSIVAAKTIPDATGDLVAIGAAFDVTADNLGNVVDALAAAKQQAGGDPKQIAQGLSSGGVSLAGAGFSLAESAQLIARVTSQLDQSGQASATRISRITSSFNSQAGRNLLGDLGIDRNASQRDQLVEIANQYEDLNRSQQARIKSVLGGTANLRELQVIINAIGGDLAGGFANGFDTAGKAQSEVDRKTSDLAGHLKELAGTLKNIQNEMFDSGLFAPFVVGLATIQPLLTTLESLLKLFNQLGELVLPDFEVAGVGLQELAVGVVEIMLLRKALRAIRASGIPVVAAETAAETANAAAHSSAAAATSAEAAAQRIAAVTRTANIGVINAETGAVIANAQAKRGAAAMDILPIGGRAGRTAGLAQGARDLYRRTDTIGGRNVPTGKIGAIVGTVVVAQEVVNGIIEATEKTTASLKKQTEAQKALASGTEGAVEALLAAAEERRQAGQGFWGTVQDTLGQGANSVLGWMPFVDKAEAGVDTEKDAERLEAAARIKQEREKSNEEERLARNKGRGRFDVIFDDFNNIDALKSGIEELDAAGMSSTRQVRALADALKGLGEESAPGTIAPGGGRRLGEQMADVFFESAVEGLTNYNLGQLDVDVEEDNKRIEEARRKVDEARKRREANRRADPGRRKDSDAAKADDEEVKAAEKELKETQKRRDHAAGVALSNLKTFNPATASAEELAKIQTEVSDTVKEFIDAVAPNGGVLTEPQLQELATLVAEKYVNKGQGGKGLAETRAEMQKILFERLKVFTDPAELIFDQSSADFVQDFFIQKGAGVESETVLRGGSKVQGVRDRIATINEGITAALNANQQVSDQAMLAILQGNKDLAAAISAEATAYENLAIAQLGADDAVGRAAGEYTQAQRLLSEAFANPGDVEALTKAQIARIEAREAFIESQVEQMNALAEARVAPGDDVGAAAAAVEAAQRTLANTSRLGADGKQTAAYSAAVKAANEAIRASINAQLEQIAALASSLTSSENVVQNALDAYVAAQNVLLNLPQFGADGKQTAEFSNAVRAQREAYAAAFKAVNRQANQIDIGAVQERDTVGKARAAELAAWRDMEVARQLGADAGTIAELLDTLEKAQIETMEALLSQRSRRRRGNIDLTDPVAVARAARQDAEDRLKTNRAAKAPAEVIEADTIALREAQHAEEAAAFSSQLQQVQTNERLGRISHQAYIDYLNNEKSRLEGIANKSYQQQQFLNEIDQALMAANEQLTGQFNLGEINVPTPYEARRSIAERDAQRQGIAGATDAPWKRNMTADQLVDGRQITVNINGGDLNQVKQVLAEYVGPVALGRNTNSRPTKI